MAENISIYQLMGFNDLFPDEQMFNKKYYAAKVGRRYIQNIACHLLSFYRTGLPSNEQLFKYWLIEGSFSYKQIMSAYNNLLVQSNSSFHILSVESSLRLFTWSLNADIPDDVPNETVSDIDAIRLYLLFNNEILLFFQRPADFAETGGSDRPFQHSILAMSFPQSDLINTDYAQLMHGQFYRAIHLLDFLETNPKCLLLYRAFLRHFHFETKQEYLKQIGYLIFRPFKNRALGPTIMELPYNEARKHNIHFFDRLIIKNEIVFEDDDYIKLRNAPLQMMSESHYRVIYDLFLVKKAFNGMYFKLRDLIEEDGSLFDEDFAGFFKMAFSEGVLVYLILNNIFSDPLTIKITGKQFKEGGLSNSEPDYYAREANKIFLFESKDIFLSGKVKSSYEFGEIEPELKKRLYKEEKPNGKIKNGAVLQLITNIKRIINRELILDNGYSSEAVEIYPCLILHDSIYSAPGLNYIVNSWLNEELELLHSGHPFNPDKFRIYPLTIIEIDTLILLSEIFKERKGSLENLIKAFHKHVQMNFSGRFNSIDDIQYHLTTSVLPFSEFARHIYNGHDLDSAIDVVIKLFQSYGID